MKTTTLTTADGREIRVHHAEDWSGQARLRFAPDSNQGDIHLPGWVARGLCRREPQCCADSRANLLARAEQAERERDQWRAKWEALETTRASCCDQMERERDEARDTAALDEIRAQQRLESLAHDHAKAVAERDEARAMFQETRRRMCRRMGQEEGKSWSALESLASALRSRLAKAEAVVEAARTDLRTADILIEGAHAGAGGTTAERLEQATRGIRAALRALDNDSGGSGAAQNGVLQKPEPAGSSPRAIVDSDTAAVGAVDSTPGTPGLASREPGDAGSNPVRSGSSGTPGPTVGAIPAAGATEPEPAGSSMDAGGFSVEPCGTRCDHGSPCTLQRDHLPACRHETEHGCICYDPEPNPKRCGANLWPASPTPCALPRGHEGVHDTYAPGIKPPSLRETHATTRREVEELRRRVGRLENLVDKL